MGGNGRAVWLAAAFLAVFFLSSCAPEDEAPSGPGRGAIVVHAIWPAAGGGALRSEVGGDRWLLPPEVVTVRAIVSGPDMANVQQDFDAAAHSGTIANVPAGADRTLTLQGLSSGGTVLYQGMTTGITITANQTTDAGEVLMEPAVAPAAPTNVTITAGDGQVTLSWDAVFLAEGYRVYWSLTPGVTKTNGARITNAASPLTHTGLTNGTAYYYVVTALNAAGESPESAEVGATPQVPAPGAPTGVSATAGDAQVTIGWSPVTGATSYNLYYLTGTGVTVTKANGTPISGVTSPYPHTPLANGTQYNYVVTAENPGGESAESAQVAATPQVPAPGAPTGLSATPGDGQVSLSWNGVVGATSYNLYMAAQSGVTKANYASLTDGMRHTEVTAPYLHTGLTNGTRYYFVVTAVNAGGESSESSPVDATPQVPGAGGSLWDSMVWDAETWQ